VFVKESAILLLWHLDGLEFLSVDELYLSINGFVFRLSFERDILNTNEIDLERVKLPPIELIK